MESERDVPEYHAGADVMQERHSSALGGALEKRHDGGGTCHKDTGHAGDGPRGVRAGGIHLPLHDPRSPRGGGMQSTVRESLHQRFGCERERQPVAAGEI